MVFRYRHFDDERVGFWLEPGEDGLELRFGHCSAPACAFAARVGDMQEYARSVAVFVCGILFDDGAPLVVKAHGAHVLGTVPVGPDIGALDDAVVLSRTAIVDAFRCRREVTVGHEPGSRLFGRVSEQRAQAE